MKLRFLSILLGTVLFVVSMTYVRADAQVDGYIWVLLSRNNIISHMATIYEVDGQYRYFSRQCEKKPNPYVHGYYSTFQEALEDANDSFDGPDFEYIRIPATGFELYLYHVRIENKKNAYFGIFCFPDMIFPAPFVFTCSDIIRSALDYSGLWVPFYHWPHQEWPSWLFNDLRTHHEDYYMLGDQITIPYYYTYNVGGVDVWGWNGSVENTYFKENFYPASAAKDWAWSISSASYLNSYASSHNIPYNKQYRVDEGAGYPIGKYEHEIHPLVRPYWPDNLVYLITGLYQDRTWIDLGITKFWGAWSFTLNEDYFRSQRWVVEIYNPEEKEDPLPAPVPAPSPTIQNTPVGSNVEISFDDHYITFDTVTTEGLIDLWTTSFGPEVPPDFIESCTPSQYFNVATTAIYNGYIEICLSYDDKICDETGLKLLHYEGYEDDIWTDVTDYPIDKANNIICGIVSSLSPFVLALPVNQPPVALCKDTTVSTDPGICTAAETSVDNGSYDPEGGSITLYQFPPAPYILGTTDVTLTVTDDKSETDQCFGTVTVVDQEVPTLTCPDPQTAECTGPDGASVSFNATAIDNCTAALSCIPPSGSSFSLGENMDTCTATDSAGNQNTCSFTVSVLDTTPPTLNVPGDVTVECEGSAGTSVNIGTATDSDICCGGDTTITNNALSLFPLGDTVVTWTDIDCNGNSVTGSQDVTVVDTISPEFTLSASPNVLWPPNHKMVHVTTSVTANDICDADLTIELEQITMNEGDESDTYDPDWDQTPGDGNTVGDIYVDNNGNIYLRAERAGTGDGRIYTITYKAIDDSGNTTLASATVYVPHNQ